MLPIRLPAGSARGSPESLYQSSYGPNNGLAAGPHNHRDAPPYGAPCVSACVIRTAEPMGFDLEVLWLTLEQRRAVRACVQEGLHDQDDATGRL